MRLINGICFFLLLAFAGCKNAAFEGFKQKFKEQKLPLVIKGCTISDTALAVVKPPQDSLEPGAVVHAYCTFPSNGNYFAAVTLYPADCFVPVLFTYDDNGNKIDEKQINIGGCGADCGFTCEEYMVINADYSIYVSDTVSQCECDSLGNEVPGTMQHYVVYKTGKILSTGKIELTGEMRKELPVK